MPYFSIDFQFFKARRGTNTRFPKFECIFFISTDQCKYMGPKLKEILKAVLINLDHRTAGKSIDFDDAYVAVCRGFGWVPKWEGGEESLKDFIKRMEIPGPDEVGGI